MLYAGFVIRKERLERSWSQEGLCKGICAVSYLSKIEQGKTEASAEILAALFERLGMHWLTEETELAEGKRFVEDWYDALFSEEDRAFSSCETASKSRFAALENSPLALDILLLRQMGAEDACPLDPRLEPCMDARQLAVQRLLSREYVQAAKLYPCAYMDLRIGTDAYGRGDTLTALENLQKAYELAAAEGNVRVMLFAKLFITNCYSSIGDVASMEHHGKIAKKMALALGETAYARTMDYNLAATKIETGDIAGAYEYFAALEDPSAPDLHKLAVCCELLGKKEEALAAVARQRAAGAETAAVKAVTDRACDLIGYRLRHEGYLTDPVYGKMLLEHFELCRKTMTAGYAKFHLPRVLEWLTAGRQYKQAYELLTDFPEK
jgi:transcriptional regulator with XRE-family HTH domain